MPQQVDIPNVGIVEFPDHMSNDQIAQAIENDILSKKASASQPQNYSKVGSFFRGAADAGTLGFGDEIVGGAVAPILKLTRPDLFGNQTLGQTYAQARDMTRQENVASAAQNPISTGIGMVAGGLGLPGKPEGILDAMKLSGLYGAGYGLGSSDKSNADTALYDAAAGGAIGGLLGGAGTMIGKGLGKAYNAVTSQGLEPEAQALIDASNKYGVRLGAADVSNNNFIKTLDQGLEEVPFIGTSGFRATQNTEAKNAAQSVYNRMQNEVVAQPFDNTNQLQSIAQSGGTRAKAAQQLLNDIEGSGNDWQKVIETSGNLKLFNNKLQADKKYQAVEDLANQYGVVPTNSTLNALDNAMQKVESSVLPDQGLSNTLSTIKDKLAQNKLNYSQLRQARSDIGSIISDAYKGSNAAVGTQGAGILQGVKDAVTRDMEAFAQQNGPELSKAWRDADSYYRTAVAPYKDVQLAKALTGGAPDEIYSKFISSGGVEGEKGTTRAAKLYSALDNKGQSAVRYGMVKNAFEKAYNPDSQNFSPALFASELDKIAAAKGVFFKGAAKAEIDGFKNLMRHVQRSNVATNKPETGVKTIPYIIGALFGGAASVAPGTTATAGAYAYGLQKLLTTQTGRNFLLSASKIKANTPAMQRAIDTFMKASKVGLVTQGLQLNKDNQ